MAVWERSRRGDLTEQSELLEFVQSQEIAYAVYDPATSAWSSPAFLSNNNYVDHTPRLATAGDGRILLVWQANASNELEGDAADPDTLYYAIWNNGAWSAPAQLGPALGDLAGWGIAYRGGEGVIVAARDTDGNPTTDSDQELFRSTWNGATWSSWTRLTNDAVADGPPRSCTGLRVRRGWYGSEATHSRCGPMTGPAI